MATSREAAAAALASITPGDTSAGRLMGALDSLVTRFDALEKRADALSPAEDRLMAKAAWQGWVRGNVPNGTNWRDANPPQRVIDAYEKAFG